MKQLIENIKKDASSHASIPFWSWNDKLEENELRRQIRNMKELGMRGFFMHARGGLETEYMSEEWFDAIKICIDEAKKLGMEAWSYDENGWPSGFAGGALLSDPRNFAKSVVLERAAEYPENSTDILGVYILSGDEITRVGEGCGADEYIIIKREADFSYVDLMDASITKKFIDATHEVYKKKLENSGFGTDMPGFFTDEPQYFRFGTPWSDTFFTTFEKRFGYEVLDKLPLLFLDIEDSKKFRHDYYLLCHEQYYNNFMKPIYERCEENGVQLTGHGIEEWGLYGQMMCCGGVMPFYLYEHIPGIDYLGRGIKNASGAKQLGSVCAQTGKKVALTESYALCGWDVSPRELKRITDLQYAGGVNLTCEHLYAYSARGQRKRDYPCHYSDHNPWQKYYSLFERHFTNLGSALSQGNEAADTLVIHPIRSAYLYYKQWDSGSLKELEAKYDEFTDDFAYNQIPYHFGDESIMRDMGRVEGDKIKIGECSYSSVVIPYIETIDKSTADMLKQYLSNGGKLYIWGKAPDRIDGTKADLSFIKSNMTYDELKAVSGIKIRYRNDIVPLHMQVRSTDFGKMIFLANVSGEEYLNTEITVQGVKGLAEIDIDTLQTRPARSRINADGSVTALYDFTDSASCLLVESETEMLPFVYTGKKPAIYPGEFTLDYLPENMMILDEAQIAKDGGEFTEMRPLTRIKDNLLSERFCGQLTMKYTFTAEVVPSSLYVVVEPMRYTSVKVNGIETPFSEGWRIDRRFRVVDIASLTKEGDNTVELTFDYRQSEYVYKVLYGGGNEALRNCLAFDTEVEPIYLFGDFGVKSIGGFTECERNTYRSQGPFILTGRDKKIDLTDIVRDGYVFYSGDMTASSSFEYKEGDPTVLRLGGRFAVCRAVINGVDLGVKIFTDEYELAPYLKTGHNELTLTLCFSIRNLLGPHHTKNPEPHFVSPTTFSFEKSWNGGECPNFVKAWSFVRLGIDF